MGSEKRRILVVDDDEGIRSVLVHMLSSIIQDNHEIHTAESGEKAVALASQITFDGAFTDMQMPGIDGLETFRGLKKLNPEMVVIIMTGAAPQEKIDSALREGAVDCLMKPFTLADVRAVLEKN